MILDSNFLIHLEREQRRNRPGPATAFIVSHASTPLFITPVIAGEIACGESMKDRAVWSAFVGFFQSLETTSEVAWQYGEIFRYLKIRGQMIGHNDLWIAATGRAYDKTIVTRNTGEFSRIPGLKVETF